ncbi:MAG: hypothetical protein A3F11_07795 [Gammaproteobacteria bacterium RIFCSPHIGHO2_12_FULL_37_14]|nr:MAG: hypothetical protein A3F11_07795 [Gammaproteobacteria bacterium RIFCSPHIGHO2_12_FULL_37_14]
MVAVFPSHRAVLATWAVAVDDFEGEGVNVENERDEEEQLMMLNNDNEIMEVSNTIFNLKLIKKLSGRTFIQDRILIFIKAILLC